MNTGLLQHTKTGLRLLLFMTVVTGTLYPLLVTGLAQFFFPWQANGSLIENKGKIIGSARIGQSFTEAHYFWSRPSATTPHAYNAANSSGSNMGPTNSVYLTSVKERIDNLRNHDPKQQNVIPIDLVTASASGLDPEISPQAAYYQISRVAQARRIPENQLRTLIAQYTQFRTLGCLGEPRVNVLQLNLALDQDLLPKDHA